MVDNKVLDYMPRTEDDHGKHWFKRYLIFLANRELQVPEGSENLPKKWEPEDGKLKGDF
jgi:hypothetical protein